MSEPAKNPTGPRLLRPEKMRLDRPLDARFASGGTRDPRRSSPTVSRDESNDCERSPRTSRRKPLRAWLGRSKRRSVALAPHAVDTKRTRQSRLASLLDRTRAVGRASVPLPSRGRVRALGLLVLCMLVWRNVERPLEVRGSDRDLVLTVDDLMGLPGGGELDPALESFSKVARLGGAVELEYVYEDDEGGPHLAFVTRFNRSESSAMDDFALTNVQTMIDWRLAGDGGVGLVPLAGVDGWADQIRAFRVEVAGKPIGYSFAARVGDRTLYMALKDVALDDPGAIEDLLGSVLDTVEASSRPR